MSNLDDHIEIGSALDRVLKMGDVTHTDAPAWNQPWCDAKAELAALRAGRDKYLEELVERRAEAATMRERIAALEKAVEAADVAVVDIRWKAEMFLRGTHEQFNTTDITVKRWMATIDEGIADYRAAREASRE